MRFEDLLIRFDACIRDVLITIDQHSVADVVVVDQDGTFLGTVREQDLRRAIIDGGVLDDPIASLVRTSSVTVDPSAERTAVLDLMRALGLRLVPIVDADGRVTGIHAEDSVLGVPRRPNWAVVMAGGKGTRLGSLTKNVPKPMLPVAGRPILERIVLHLVGSGIDRIFLSVNYLASVIEKHFEDGAAFGCTIEYLREETDRPLGTGGALALLADLGYHPTHPVIVMNGDLVTDFSVGQLLDFHQCAGHRATIATSEYHHQVPWCYAKRMVIWPRSWRSRPPPGR
ncbi:sugar phosphate nucleotidyltransferase [Amycolatopsis thermoflava]|uniref:sugar phosphate nucleotidyltransferase n=1 Tax=Amycolatopsis thermoflava TaxID=84480 RepID=UPI00364C80A0